MKHEEFIHLTGLLTRMVEFKIAEALDRADKSDRYQTLLAHEDEFVRLHIDAHKAAPE